MAFNRNDIYTGSGSVQLYNSWTPYVSKYDTSSFYNWEQDNLPLYDLEERTYELWEQAGFATSAGVPGLALTVSADAPAAVLAANRNVFTSLSACIAAIPKVVRFPVLVEVANFGDLGNLELHNFRIEEGGSIEIINRAFARIYSASSTAPTAVAGSAAFNATHNHVKTVSSIDLSSTLTDTSCISIATRVLSGGMDDRTVGVGNIITYPRHTLKKAPLSVAVNQDLLKGQDNIFGLFNCVEHIGLTSDSTLGFYDISSTNQSTGLSIRRGVLTTAGADENVGGVVYFNRLGKASIKNCDGPIFIRNFFATGRTERPVGFEVSNSDVVLENCTAIRFKESGFKFNNSKVVLSRSAFAYRNYEVSSTSVRVPNTGYGFHAINSDVLVSSLPLAIGSTSIGDTGASANDCTIIASRNYAGFVLDNSKISGGLSRTSVTQPLEASILASELNTGYGILMNNSIATIEGLIDIYGNNVGVETNNSKFTFEEFCCDANNSEGVVAKNSNLIWESSNNPTAAGQSSRFQLDMSANGQHLNIQNNSYFGFRKQNSIPQTYGNSRFRQDHGVDTWDGTKIAKYPAILVDKNSTVELLHSNIEVDNAVAYATSYGRAIRATNGSVASLYGSTTGATHIQGPDDHAYQKYMAGLYGGNNSVINIHGPTVMYQFGVNGLVEDNSTLNIHPPILKDSIGYDVNGFDLSNGANHTHVELHSTRACLVANKNSSINLIDLGTFNKNWNRTANGQAFLALGYDYRKDLPLETSAYIASGSLQFYPNPQDDSIIIDNNLDDLALGGAYSPASIPTFSTVDNIVFTCMTGDGISSPNWTKRNKITKGGTCLRVTQDSTVTVKNVHFPLGTNSSELDGFFYNASGTDCDKIMIWNIADTSKLNASYLSISGMHPTDSSYHGPSAIWVSSNGTGGYRAAYGAPSGTPETGSLSILDIFGAGSSLWLIPSGVSVNSPFERFYPPNGSETTLQRRLISQAGMNYSVTTTFPIGATPHTSNNQGVFRIYWSPKPCAKILQTDLSGYMNGAFPHGGDFSGVVGPAYQIFAQGYNCSAPVSAVLPTGATNASGAYPELIKLVDSNGDGITDTLWTSGFYYCSEMLEEHPSQCVLDESAAKTFANAQNASVGFAGRPRKVTIHRAYGSSDKGSEMYNGDVSGSIGFKSASIFDLSRDN